MEKSNINNIFVSHYHADSKKIESLRDLLSKKDITMRDSSIYEAKDKNNANNPDYIKSLIRPQIQWAGKVIVLIGPKTSESDWVNWEIKYAAEKGKRIVGVFLSGATDADIPVELRNYGDALVAWNSDKIGRALNGEDLWDHDNSSSNEITRTSC